MDEIRLYDIDSEEFSELIDSAKVSLKDDEKYKKLKNEIQKIMGKFPNLQLLLEDNLIKNLNETECKMLQKIISLYTEISILEEQKIFFLGARENYFYLKNLNLLKE